MKESALELDAVLFDIPETAFGQKAANDDDHAALAQGMVLYDALYAWSRKATAETHNWPSAVIR